MIIGYGIFSSLSASVRYPPHQFFSIDKTKKLDTNIPTVKIISNDEFSLLIILLVLSDRMYDYWYKAWASVINGTLFVAGLFLKRFREANDFIESL